MANQLQVQGVSTGSTRHRAGALEWNTAGWSWLGSMLRMDPSFKQIKCNNDMWNV